MRREEYIETIVYNGQMINIGLNDYGQEYFIEYVNEDEQLVEEGCGSYNTDYMPVIEQRFGNPTMCEKYLTQKTCSDIFAHGYCSRCQYNELLQRNKKRTT